jgi:hypothetical protein
MLGFRLPLELSRVSAAFQKQFRLVSRVAGLRGGTTDR